MKKISILALLVMVIGSASFAMNSPLGENSKFKIIYGKMFKKYINGGKKYFNLNYESMNPYGQWLKKFPVIIDTFDHIVSAENIPDYLDTELKEDLIKIYNNNIFEFRNKFAVVTAILAIKLHFEEN